MRILSDSRTRLCRRSLILAATCAASLAAAGAAHAATLTVNSTADQDTGSCGSTCTLRDAVNYSSSGDTIAVPAGTYTLTQGQLEVSHDLTITGAGSSSVTVSGGGNSRVFLLDGGDSLTLSGMTITGGNGSGGETPDDGGGILAYGPLTLSDVTVTGNTALYGGGGIWEEDTTLSMDSSTVSDNTVQPNNDDGAGIACSYCTAVSINNSTVSGNHDVSGEQAGVIGGANPHVVANGASDLGGGIYLSVYSQIDFAKPQLATPHALPAAGTAQITNTTVSGNSMSDAGGGIYLQTGTLDLSNATISGNGAGTQGGGIDDENTMNSVNNTLASNSAPTGANVYVDDSSFGGFENTLVAEPQGGQNCATSGVFPPSQGHNLEDDEGQSCGFTASGDISGVSADLGGLADNGGPTQTMALLAGSPAIDHGATVAAITTDQRGGPRPQPAGGAYDIGTYERGAVVDMGIKKTVLPKSAQVGSLLHYTLTVTNNGPSPDPAYAVTVADKLPSALKFQAAKASQGKCSYSKGTLTCDLGTINQGSSATVKLKVTAKKAGKVTNTGIVSSSAKDYNPGNDKASAKATVTASGSPGVLTGDVTQITSSSAWLHGQIDPNGTSTTFYFVYGTNPGDPRTQSASAGKGTKRHGVRQKLTGLKPHTRYYYRIVASNARGKRSGQVRSFRTAAAAPVFTG